MNETNKHVSTTLKELTQIRDISRLQKRLDERHKYVINKSNQLSINNINELQSHFDFLTLLLDKKKNSLITETIKFIDFKKVIKKIFDVLSNDVQKIDSYNLTIHQLEKVVIREIKFHRFEQKILDQMSLEVSLLNDQTLSNLFSNLSHGIKNITRLDKHRQELLLNVENANNHLNDYLDKALKLTEHFLKQLKQFSDGNFNEFDTYAKNFHSLLSAFYNSLKQLDQAQSHYSDVVIQKLRLNNHLIDLESQLKTAINLIKKHQGKTLPARRPAGFKYSGKE
jgi:hypothetical protein